MKQNGGIQLPRDNDGNLDLGKLADLGKQEKAQQHETLMDAGTQANELMQTVKCTLGPSKVQGIGVIALRDLKAGEKVYCALSQKPRWYTISFSDLKKYLNKTYPEILRLILDRWPHVVNGSSFISPNYDARLISFMNHADRANYSPVTDCAIVDIKAGEELFEDYRTIPNYEKAYPWLSPPTDD